MTDQADTILVIVPDIQGQAALADIPRIKVVVLAPGQPVPVSAQQASILVVGPAEQQFEVDDALRQIRQLPNLRLLQTLGQGTEQWDGVLPADVTVATARGAHGGSTAEWAVTALLSLIRDLPFYAQNQRDHHWEGRQARTLLRSRVLIYGVGDLGDNIRRRLEPFGADVTMVARTSREGVISTEQARELLPETDAVILALPLSPSTEHFVDASFLAALPDNAIVVNAGRGGLVDQVALLKELTNQRLQAALDVMTPEPLPADHPLWDAPGLLLTPHVGGNTQGSGERAWHMAAQSIRKFIAAA